MVDGRAERLSAAHQELRTEDEQKQIFLEEYRIREAKPLHQSTIR